MYRGTGCRGMLHMYGQWGTGVWDTSAMGHRGMGTCMDNEVQGYGALGYKGMGHMGNGVQRYGAHVWAMRYRGVGHMGNGAQGYGTHGQWGT